MKPVTVKLYAWKDLARLILADMAANNLVPKGSVHFLGGIDVNGHPYLRVDLTPISHQTKRR